MCGILGLINTPWKEYADSALKPLYNRGPDEQNFWSNHKAILGHTRLSIIDLDNGHQPMCSDDGRFVLVFNGELYNFQSLRKKLELYNFSFKTNSDTEVVLKAFMHWKEKTPLFLDGMFAFSIWDVKAGRLFCARDRVGIKPFFYSSHSGFIFSSSLKSFLQITSFPKDLNFLALRDFLAFQTCLAPESFLKHVKQLPPSSQLTWDSNTGKLVVSKYWKPSSIHADMDKAEAIHEVDRILRKSVQEQMVSDVPLGAFLSGGIDSSLMMYYMSEVSSNPVDAFTLKFNQSGYDESLYAREVSDYFGCSHHILESPNIDGRMWSKAISELDQPLADPAYVMTYSLSHLTKKHVTVSISGDGGDELFAGYERLGVTPDFFPEKYFHNGVRFLVENNVAPGALLRRSLSGRERLFYNRVELGPWTHGRKNMLQFIDRQFHDLMSVDDTLSLWKHLSKDMSVKNLMDADLWTYLSENCLTKTDRASMAYGLEVRVPMLSNSMLDFATSIPVKHHFDHLGGKSILRELSKKYLPDNVWNREKHGFSVPLQDLFNGSWGEEMDDLFDSCQDVAPFLDQKNVKSLWAKSKEKKASRRLSYTFAVLLQWLSSNNI